MVASRSVYGLGSGDPIEAERVRRATRARLFGDAAEPVRLGRFEIREQLGAGGMGVVYAAFDPQLHRTVAVKLLVDGGDDGGARLLDEARAMAAVRDPGLVAVHDVGEWQGHVFVAMERVDGPSLRDWLRAAARAPADVIAAFVTAGRALAALHAGGFVHRDFKPDNVVIDADGRARLVDFGLARRAGAPADLAGTPAYVAPELRAGAAPTAASDQYAFCVALLGAGVTLPARAARIAARGSSARPDDRWPAMTAVCDALADDPVRRWRGRIAAVALAAGAGVSVAVIAGRLDDAAADPCAAGGERLRGVWDDAREAELAAAFGDSDAPRSAASAGLDRYAGAWRAAHRDACEATHVRREQSPALLDLRMTCLERRRTALAVTVDLLAHADAAAIERAAAIVGALPALEPCADADAVRATMPPPDDPTARDAIAALDERRARGLADTAAARFDDALAGLTAVVDEARAIGHKPTIAEAVMALAYAESQAGSETADARLFEAVTAGQAAGHLRVVAEAATRLAARDIFFERFQSADTLTALADATIEAVGGDPRLRALHDTLLAKRGFNDGKFDAALVHAQRAVGALRELDAGESMNFTGARYYEASVLQRLGRYDEARAAYDEVLAVRTRLLGALHPEIATTTNAIATLDEDKGDFPAAYAGYMKAHDIAMASGGTNAALAARFLDHAAGALRGMGRVEEAMAKRLEALRMREALLPADSSELGDSYNNLGTLYLQAADYDQAEAYFTKALAIMTKNYGLEHPQTAYVLGNLGDVALGREQWAVGVERHRQALAALEASVGPDHADLIEPLVGVATGTARGGDLRAGITLAERAVRIGETTGANPGGLARARFQLAQIRAAAGDAVGARRDAQAALDGWKAMGNEPRAAMVADWLRTL